MAKKEDRKMIIQELENMEEFTNNEKGIATYILNNISEIIRISADELAEKTFTSKASIMRLCRKLGTKGYREFQRTIDKEYAELSKVSRLIGEEPINSNTEYAEIKDILPAFYGENIQNIKISLDDTVMEKVIEKLKKAKKIELYGVGIGQLIAKLAAFKFMTLGIESEAYDGINEHYIASSKKGKEDVAIMISLTGNNPYVIKAAKLLRRRGVYIIGIAENIAGEFRELCSEYIEINSMRKHHILSMEILSSVTVINYILDIFFTSLLVENYYDNVKASVEVWKL